jgi:hypothetical protein
MTSTRYRWPRLLLVACLTLGCDPVRPGTASFNLPAPVRLSSGIDSGSISLATQRYQPIRNWYSSFGPPVPLFVTPPRAVDPWSLLADAFNSPSVEERMLGRPGVPWGSTVLGELVGAPDYLFTMSPAPAIAVQPVGASELPISTPMGFQIFHRTCTTDEPNHFEPVSLDTIIEYDPAAAATQQAGVDPYLAHCNLPFDPTLDLGEVAATLPDDSWAGFGLPMMEMAWAPTADAVYALAGTFGRQTVELFRMEVGQPGVAQLTYGDLYGPLQVATGGTTLIFNQTSVEWSSDRLTPTVGLITRLAQSFKEGQLFSPRKLPIDQQWPPAGVNNRPSPTGVLSPDGATLATTGSESGSGYYTQLIDVAKATVSVRDLGRGAPLAWDPSGQLVLVADDAGGASSLSVEGVASSLSPTLSDVTETAQSATRYFWSASGPLALVQGYRGTFVLDIVTKHLTTVVEANRVAPPTAPLAVVVATNQVFAWALQCFGIGETSCNGELRRLSIATGLVDVVARAGSPFPFAVSPDGTKLAVSDGKSIYLKNIPP